MGDIGYGVFQEFLCAVLGFLAGFQGCGHVVDSAEQAIEAAIFGLGKRGVETAGGVGGDGFHGFLVQTVL